MEDKTMKKAKLLAALLCSACLVTGSTVPAMADGMKVVTLGADLTEEQKNTMLRYFQVSADEVEILTITNQDERDHLSAYVPLEQIGTRTVSCAYVKPTTSGGIKVRTANLNWVTCNMIASTLSTSGVKNCEVVAACPFEVSGTGALTGIQMAYETATGETLDETKKEIATEEMVVTGNLAEQIGQTDATTIINQAKIQVIQDNLQNEGDIYNVVVNIINQNNAELSADEIDKIVSLLTQIAEQDYDYDDMKDTLERVDENLTGSGSSDDTNVDTDADTDADDEDSIIDGLDESILGDDVIAGSTEDPTLSSDSEISEDDSEFEIYDDTDDDTIDISYEENYSETDLDDVDSENNYDETYDENYDETYDENYDDENYDEVYDETTENNDADSDIQVIDEEITEEDLDAMAAALSEQSASMYKKAKLFCSGEYEGNVADLEEVMGEEAYVSVYLEDETAKKLTKEVEMIYLTILSEGTGSYVPTEEDIYLTPELNVLETKLKEVFTIDDYSVEGEDILEAISQDEKEMLYNDTMKFFEQLYGESTSYYEEETYNADSYDETQDSYEESYEE
jgi:uncharacterized protein YpuA (DUF1002 family)